MGYAISGEEVLTERFNVNNKELNKKRFLEANCHVFKNKLIGKAAKGAKFCNQELDFNLSPTKVNLEEFQFSQDSILQKRNADSESESEDDKPRAED